MDLFIDLPDGLPAGFSPFGIRKHLIENCLPAGFERLTLQVGSWQPERLVLVEQPHSEPEKSYSVTREQARFELTFAWEPEPSDWPSRSTVIFPGKFDDDLLDRVDLENIAGDYSLDRKPITIVRANIDETIRAARMLKLERFYFISPQGDMTLHLKRDRFRKGAYLGMLGDDEVVGMIQAGDVPIQIHEMAGRTVFDYSVSFVQDGEQRGSGTLFEIDGMKGILTVHHVAEPLLRNREKPINVIFREDKHIFDLPHHHLEHITLDQESTVFDGCRWPDLSFLRILDSNKAATIASIRSFYPYSNNFKSNYIKDYGAISPYLVIGAPVSKGGKDEGDGMKVIHFCASAQFKSLSTAGNYEVLGVTCFAGQHGFPENFEGVSGGGIWAVPLVMDHTIDPPQMTFDPPLLAAVAFHQSDLVSDCRVISGIKIELAMEALRAKLPKP